MVTSGVSEYRSPIVENESSKTKASEVANGGVQWTFARGQWWSTASRLYVMFPPLNGHQVCRVRVRPSVLPVFVNEPGGAAAADFYAGAAMPGEVPHVTGDPVATAEQTIRSYIDE